MGELQNALKTMGQELTMEEVENLIQEVDANGDGEVQFDEFKVMIGQTWFINAYQNKMVKSIDKALTKMNVLVDGDESNDDEEDGDDKKIEKEDENKNEELMEEIKQKIQIIEGLQNEMKEMKDLKEENERKQMEKVEGLEKR